MIREIGAEGGWISIPPRRLYIGTNSEMVSFHAFLPRPIAAYESEYDPSIMMEVGERAYAEDGKPSGEIKQVFVKRSHLEGQDEKQQIAENKFEEIEEGFFAYINFTEIPKLD
jgi:hypothetical protein